VFGNPRPGGEKKLPGFGSRERAGRKTGALEKGPEEKNRTGEVHFYLGEDTVGRRGHKRKMREVSLGSIATGNYEGAALPSKKEGGVGGKAKNGWQNSSSMSSKKEA